MQSTEAMSQSLLYHAFGIPKTYGYVIDLSRIMTILDVAELTMLCWDTVKGIVKERLAKDYKHIRLKLYALHEAKHKLVG